MRLPTESSSSFRASSASSLPVRLMLVDVDQAADLTNFCKSIYRQHYEHLWHEGGSAWYQETTYGADTLRRELRDPGIRHYFIEVDGARAGYLKLELSQDLPDQPNGLEISRVYLSSEFTGQGTGRRVLSEVCALAMNLQRRYVWLHVMDSSEAAIRFYASSGFEIVGATILPFELMKPRFRRMLQMRKLLTPAGQVDEIGQSAG